MRAAPTQVRGTPRDRHRDTGTETLCQCGADVTSPLASLTCVTASWGQASVNGGRLEPKWVSESACGVTDTIVIIESHRLSNLTFPNLTFLVNFSGHF